MIYPAALPENASSVFARLASLRKFYLGGDTALALQIGHRVSVDFDCFSPRPIATNLLSRLKKLFPHTAVIPSVNHSGELTVFVDQTKLTFLTYPFRRVLPLISLGTMKALSVKEIAATKAYTIGRRGEFKDYVDLYFVLSEGHATLEGVLRLAEKKYGDEFNGRLFLEQLLYLEDIEQLPLVFLKEAVTKAIIEKRFIQEIQKLKLAYLR